MRIGSDFVAGADNLASAQTATGDERAEHAGPMIPSGFLVDDGSAAELAHDYD